MVVDAFSPRPFRGDPAGVVLMNGECWRLTVKSCKSLVEAVLGDVASWRP